MAVELDIDAQNLCILILAKFVFIDISIDSNFIYASR